MIFNSIPFLIFFSIFFIFYWFVFNKNLKLQNLLLLAGSYVFYAWADWRFLFFLVGISVLNFYLGISIAKNTKNKRLFVCIGLIQGIGSLAFFKYFNFFITSFHNALQLAGINANVHTLNIITPIGISFFTFKTLSYLLDIDKGKSKPTTDPIVFFSYVAFFPTVLSGPIDKAKLFIPQLEKNREFNYSQATDGLRQILWGLFKKAVIADNCAAFTNQAFDHYQTFPASSLLFAAFLYTIELYADFSGYSDMAIGFSRLIGFTITKNFDFPLFSQNIAEFWRKWHISLTIWLTEYVFTPLSIAFRDYNKLGLIIAILINFTIIGIWHGANWTYVLFGFLHGCYFIPLILKGTMNKKKKIVKGQRIPSFREFINMLGTFTLISLTFILFRADSIGQAYHYFYNLFSISLFSIPQFEGGGSTIMPISIASLFLLSIEWFGREQQYAIEKIASEKPKILRWSFYYFLVIIIFVFAGSKQHFIYFQF